MKAPIPLKRVIMGILAVLVLIIVVLLVVSGLNPKQAVVQGTATPSPANNTPQSSATERPTQAPTQTEIPQATEPAPTGTPQPTADPNIPPACTEIGQTWTSPIDGMTLVCVPAGEFTMGSDNGDGDEKPIHQVALDAYWIDKTEVTNAMFTQFIQSTGYETDAEKGGSGWVYNASTGSWEDTAGADWQHPQGPNSDLSGLGEHPVAQVSWNDAAAYCAWAGRELPSEAQWEKAARGTDGRTYPWGEAAPAGDLVNFADANTNFSHSDKSINDGYQYTAPVGHYPDGVSPYGAYDMAGNVWEWVSDWYDSGYYSNSPSSNPTGPATGDIRILRGGSWYNDDDLVRSSNRNRNNPDARNYYDGFRCSESPASP